jgi:HSP20 family protein
VSVDISETTGGDAFLIEIPVPGLMPDELVIEANDDSLTVSTEPQQSQMDSGQRCIQRDQPVRARSRLFEFPEEIDTDNVKAALENGMLRIRVPKTAAPVSPASAPYTDPRLYSGSASAVSDQAPTCWR